jgi:hypothetical protein
MARFPFFALVVLAGCASTPPASATLVRLSASPPNAFGVASDALKAAPEVFRQKIDPTELLGEFSDFPSLELLPESVPLAKDPAEPLVAILKEFVAPGQWDGRSLDVKDGELVVRHAPEVLTAVQSALKTLRDNRGRLIRSQVRMQALRADALARLENLPLAGGGLAGRFDRLALLEVLREVDPDAVVHAPRITSFHGQKCHVLFLSQRAYVAGYEADGGRFDPIVSIASEGVVAELRTVSNGSRPDEFLLSFDVQVASPTELVQVRLGPGVIDMPAQGYARLSGRCTLRSDQALLLVTRNPDVRRVDRPLVALLVTIGWAE